MEGDTEQKETRLGSSLAWHLTLEHVGLAILGHFGLKCIRLLSTRHHTFRSKKWKLFTTHHPQRAVAVT